MIVGDRNENVVVRELAKRNERAIKREIAKRTQAAVAKAIGVEKSNFNRFCNSTGHGLQLDKLCQLLAELGIDLSILLAVESSRAADAEAGDMVQVSRSKYSAMVALLRELLGAP